MLLRTQMRPIVRPIDRVAWSVCHTIILTGRAKTAQPIEMPFGLRTRDGPGTMHGVHIPHGKGNFEGEGRPIVKYRDTLRSSV